MTRPRNGPPGKCKLPGQWFQVDFGATKIFNRITIQSGKPESSTAEGWLEDYPRGYEIYLSEDGEIWGDPVASGTGSNQLTEIGFDAAQLTRFVKIVQTDRADPNWWTIFELSFFYDDTLVKP